MTKFVLYSDFHRNILNTHLLYFIPPVLLLWKQNYEIIH